jgi:hypothetical protein
MTAGLPRSRLDASEQAPFSVARIHPDPLGPSPRVFGYGEVMMTATPNFASEAVAGAVAGGSAAPAAGAGPYVLNLCSSTTPMALAQTDLPELKRFTFFVSRRFEEGRERFRLHMGHFATLAEAEEWLGLVREIYPGAWAGEAPGRKLRERAAAAAAVAQHAAGPQPHAPLTATARMATLPPPATIPAAPAAVPPALHVPVVHAAPRLPSRATRAAVAPAVTPPASPPPAARAPSVPVPAATPAPAATRPPPAPPIITQPASAALPVPRPRVKAPPGVNTQPTVPTPPRGGPVQAARGPRPGAVRPGKPAVKQVFEDSNVREVLKALGDTSTTGETRLMQAPPPPRQASAESGGLSDTQVLKLLEARRPEGGDPAEQEGGGIPLLKPDDTGTRRALKEALVNNAPVAFAVQLQWSVQPVELDKVPPLAIFSAYTLYTVEGSRDARKWYGLRLGFFSDAIAAKQVAHYVRSEFTSVAVVPVSPQEKARATDEEHAATLAAPIPVRGDRSDEFKLIDDDGRAQTPPMPAAARAGANPPAKPVARMAVGRALRQSAPPARARVRGGGKVGARDKRGPQTLEETLEILGASELSIDTGNGETLNDSGVRHLRVEVQKNSPFSKLLERLSERMRKL